MIDEAAIRQRFKAMHGQLDERGLRLLAAAEARTAGYGGIAAVAQVTGLAPSTIGRGLEGTWPTRARAVAGPAASARARATSPRSRPIRS